MRCSTRGPRARASTSPPRGWQGSDLTQRVHTCKGPPPAPPTASRSPAPPLPSSSCRAAAPGRPRSLGPAAPQQLRPAPRAPARAQQPVQPLRQPTLSQCPPHANEKRQGAARPTSFVPPCQAKPQRSRSDAPIAPTTRAPRAHLAAICPLELLRDAGQQHVGVHMIPTRAQERGRRSMGGGTKVAAAAPTPSAPTPACSVLLAAPPLLRCWETLACSGSHQDDRHPAPSLWPPTAYTHGPILRRPRR
jgi:hypothetical protein